MDLIERAKALDFEMEIEAPPDLIQAIMDGMSIYMEYIKQIPAAEARPVVRGEWVPHPDPRNREWDVCTACGLGTNRREYGENPDGTEYVMEYGYIFCPHCGADMRAKP